MNESASVAWLQECNRKLCEEREMMEGRLAGSESEIEWIYSEKKVKETLLTDAQETLNHLHDKVS